MAPMLLASVAKVDALVFFACAVIVLGGALGVIVARNPIHSALMLVMTLFGVAVLFVSQQAHFLAAVQVIVYAGAIVVLFLFVIMLLGVDRSEDLGVEMLKAQRPLAGALALIAALEMVLLVRYGGWVTGGHSVAGVGRDPKVPNVELLARSIFSRYLLAFEATSVLLVIAVVGAVVLARRPPRLKRIDEQAGP
jgi:NADH-quinone oxidoreductase subunit J